MMPTDEEVWERIDQTVSDWFGDGKDLQTAEKEISMWLRPRAYGPWHEPITDTKGWRYDELSTVLNLQVKLVQGHRQWWGRFSGHARIAPALRLECLSNVQLSAPWLGERWEAAVKKTDPEGAIGSLLDPMVALVGHPVWLQLSEIGRPFPPFFPITQGGGSHAPWVHDIWWKKAEGLGLPMWACQRGWQPLTPEPWTNDGRITLAEWLAIREAVLANRPPPIYPQRRNTGGENIPL